LTVPAAAGRRYDLVLFDFDGTLADTYPWFASVLNDVADRYRFRRVTPHEADALRGSGARAIMRHLGIPAWKLPLITRHMHALAARDAGAMTLFPGVPAMLATLDAAGFRLGIVSSNREAHIRAVLGPREAARIRHFACSAPLFGKARRLRTAMRAAGAHPSRTLYVGDEIRDHEAARAAVCDFGAVAWGYTRVEALALQAPALTFARPAEIGDRLVRAHNARPVAH
jgi:phosphoglycolate phosphatase